MPVTSLRRDGLPDGQSCGQVAGGLLPVRKEGEDLSPRAGRRAQVRSVVAPGWQSVRLAGDAGMMSALPVIAGDVDRNLSTKAMDDANTAGRVDMSGSWQADQFVANPFVAAASGQEPGQEARSAGTGSLRAGRGCSPGCGLLLWRKDGQRLQNLVSGTTADRSGAQQVSVPCPDPAVARPD